MKSNKIINWITVIILCSSFLILYYEKNIKNPCDSPITYKIDSFDNRFGISKEEFLSIIKDAEIIWEKPINRNLFEYNEKGNVTINLVCDDRQKTTEQNKLLKADTEKINNSATEIKQQYTSLKENYSAREQEYNTAIQKFEINQKDYNEQVAYWNANGGAPKEIYNALLEKENNLKYEYSQIEQERIDLQKIVNDINDFIHTYNLLINDANSKINTINKTAGKEFEEGLYDPNTNTINIYEFSTDKKLIRVLAHELGHAMSLNHNENPESIMYALNQSNSSVLTKDDIKDLKLHCKLP